MRSKIGKIVLTLSLMLCMMTALFSFNVNAEENNPATKIDDCSKVFKAYTAERASAYLEDDKYPTKDGYLFAGWYTTDELPESDEEAVEYAVEDSIPEGVEIVYALFVPDDVLTIKAQASVHLIDNKVTEADENGALRFVTTVDSLLYKKVGFELSYVKDGVEKKATSASNKVYKALYQADSTQSWSVTPAESFCGVSEYFKACTVKNIEADNYATEFTVKAFWVTMSGDTVYGATAVKVLQDGCTRKTVYVSSTPDIAADLPYYGTEANPYASLDYAIAHVEDGGIVRVKDSLTVASDATWTKHEKSITITGDGKDDDKESGKETLDFSTQSAHLNIRDNVTFSALNLKFKQYVFCNGYSVKVASDTTVLDNEQGTYIYGGAQTTTVKSTNLELYAGSYLFIYGGGHNENAHVTGNTNVVVGPGVNASADPTSHEKVYLLYGGCRMASVGGNTNVTVLKAGAGQTPAKFNYVYGGGGYHSNTKATATVAGTTNVEFAGQAYSVYGGGRYGTNADTCVVMTGGEVSQVFGGCENNSMTGNVDIQVLGGTVKRRLYGGCYNADDNSWGTDNHVTGNIFVSIGTDAEANLALNSENDNSLYALTRDSVPYDSEKGVFIFNDYENSSSNISKIGPDLSVQVVGVSQKTHHYQVNASAGGKVTAAGNCIYIEPKDNNKATVRLDSASGTIVYYAEESGYYPLPELVNGEREVYVTFDTTEATDFMSGAAAKISTGNDAYVYYATLDEAIAAAEKSENAKVTAINATNLASISIEDSANGTVTSDYKNCVAGTEVTLAVTPDEGYYCSSLSVKKDGEKIQLPALTLAGKTYAFTTEAGAYTVEATFVKKVFQDPKASDTITKWNVQQQNQVTEILSNGASKIVGVIGANGLSSGDSTLQTYKQYTDMELTMTLREVASGTGTTVLYSFDGGYTFALRAVEQPAGTWALRVVGGSKKPTDTSKNNYYNVYEFDEAETEAYKNGDGLKVRLVKYGTELLVYVNGKQVDQTVDLAHLAQTCSQTITASTVVRVGVRLHNPQNIPEISIPFSIIDTITPVIVNVSENPDGTVELDKVNSFIGEVVTLTVTPKMGYYCKDLKVTNNNQEVSLDSTLDVVNTVYKFTVVEGEYNVQATFAKKVFQDPKASDTITKWNVQQQNQVTEILSNGASKITGVIGANGLSSGSSTLQTYEQYTDMELNMTLREVASGTGTTVLYSFDGGYTFALRAVEQPAGTWALRVVGGSKNPTNTSKDYYYNVYEFNDIEAEAYKNGKGLEVRLVKYGTELLVYVNGKQVEQTVDLAQLAQTCSKTITASTAVRVGIRLHNPQNISEVSIPFTIINRAMLAKVTINKMTGGTVEVDKAVYNPGDVVTLTVTPDSEAYYCNKLIVTKDGESVALNETVTLDGETYTFNSVVGDYIVDATFGQKVFQNPKTSDAITRWNVLQQNQKTEILANGGTKITGVIGANGLSSGDSTLQTYEQYTDVELTVKLKEVASGTGTTIVYSFEGGYTFALRAIEQPAGTWALRVVGGSKKPTDTSKNNYYNVYEFSEAETEIYTKGEGLEVRLVKCGTEIFAYVNGKLVEDTIDLAQLAQTCSKTITASTAVRVGIRLHNPQNIPEVSIPFSITDKVTPIIVEATKSGTLVSSSNASSNTQNIHLTSNETYSVTLTPQGFDSTAYFKITYVDHVTKETQSVYTPAVAAGESFEFTYQNGLFDAETEAEIATIRWENRIKATKDVLTVEVISGTPEGDTIVSGATLGNAPMAKPASTTVTTNWTKGKNVASDEHENYPNSITDGQNYAHTDVIHVAKKGTKLTFTDNKKDGSWASNQCYVVSSWKEVEPGTWELDLEGTNIRGKQAASQLTCTDDYERFIERYGTDTSDTDGSITYTYITSKDDEYIRFCYFAGVNDDNATGNYPKITMTYSGETGTAEEIALAEATSTWLEKDKTRAYYDIFEGKTISVIGDSYMAGSNIADTADVWVNMFATKYNMTMNNHGVNGSTISNYVGSTYNPMVDRWEEDFANDTPDIIIVEGGRNDYNYNTPMGVLGNSDTATFRGATTCLISSLREKYPHAIIIGITCWEVGGEKNEAGYYCSDYGRAFIEVCEDLGVSYINAMDSDTMGVYMTSSNYRGRFCIKAGDISHLNEKGMKLVLPVFERKIYEFYDEYLNQ